MAVVVEQPNGCARRPSARTGVQAAPAQRQGSGRSIGDQANFAVLAADVEIVSHLRVDPSLQSGDCHRANSADRQSVDKGGVPHRHSVVAVLPHRAGASDIAALGLLDICVCVLAFRCGQDHGVDGGICHALGTGLAQQARDHEIGGRHDFPSHDRNRVFCRALPAIGILCGVNSRLPEHVLNQRRLDHHAVWCAVVDVDHPHHHFCEVQLLPVHQLDRVPWQKAERTAVEVYLHLKQRLRCHLDFTHRHACG